MKLNFHKLFVHLVAILIVPVISFAADGADDIAVISIEPENFAYITRNPGDNTDSWMTELGENRDITYISGDFNNDDDDDIACLDFDADDDPYLFFNQSPGDVAPVRWNNSLRNGDQYFYYFLPGDFDGDGNDDVAMFYRYYEGADPVEDIRAKITYGPTGVSATSDMQDWSFAGMRKAAFISGYFRHTDINLPDSSDVVAVFNDAGQLKARIYERNVFDDNTDWNIPSPVDQGAEVTPVAVGAGNFNGDAHYDVAVVYYDPTHPIEAGRYTAVVVFGPDGSTDQEWNLGADSFINFNFGDFDGDGYHDIAGVLNVVGGDRPTTIFHGQSNGQLNGTSAWSLAGNHTATAFLVGDFGKKLSLISGTVYRKGGVNPLPNVVVDLKDNLNNVIASTTTASNGSYSFNGLANATYTVEPRQYATYQYVPQTRVVVVNNADMTGQNFIASIDPAIFTISGKVTSHADGTALAGVTVTAVSNNGDFVTRATKSVTTNSQGNYSITVSNGTFSITPSWHPDLVFVPVNRSVTINNSSVGNVNFTDSGADQCPRDPGKTAPGACGCGVADTDTDGDGVPDCLDQCPTNLNKQTVGVCGCGWNREEEDVDDNGVADCNERQNLHTVSGKLYIYEDGQRKLFFVDDDERRSGIADIYVRGRRGNNLFLERVKVNREDSSFQFTNLAPTPVDENGNPEVVEIGGVQHAKEGYTFWIDVRDTHHYSVSREYQMQNSGRTGFGCSVDELDVLDRTKDIQCRFDPLILTSDFAWADQKVNGCIDDTDGDGSGRRIIGREMGKGRKCFEIIDEDNKSRELAPTAPTNLTASKGTRSEGVMLTWTASSRVDYYTIYRTQFPEEKKEYRREYDRFSTSSSTRAVTTPVFKGQPIKLQMYPDLRVASSVSYLDRTAVPGVKYDYVVRAFNPAGGSAYSNPAEGWRTTDLSYEDSDGDGVSDEREVLDDTNRYDPGSLMLALKSPAFTKYNTFFNQQNWLELINPGQKTVDLYVRIYDQFGQLLGEPAQLSLQPGQQFDFDIPGHLRKFFSDISNRYGAVRIDFNQGPGVELRGRMAAYRVNPGEEFLPDAERSHSFAFVRELRNRMRGASYATSNTYDPQGMGNLVPNWLEIINLDDVPRNFTQRIYDIQGNLLYDSDMAVTSDGRRRPPISVPARGEFDVQAGHEFGESVYLVEVVPHDGATNYIASLVRYSSNSRATGDNISFNFAMPIDSRAGSGDLQYVPIGNKRGACWMQTNWIETTNVRSRPIAAQVRFLDHLGAIRGETTVYLKPKGQEHLNASAMLPEGFIGQAEIVPSDIGSIIVQSNTYFHDCRDNRTQTAYTSPGQTPRRSSIIGSFNSFHSMQNLLRVINTGGETIDYNLNVTRADSIAQQAYGLSPYQSSELNLNQQAFAVGVMPPNSYGPITIQSTRNKVGLIGENVRVKTIYDGIDFAVPTPVR